MKIRTPEELINFIQSINLEDLCLDSISLKFNREKWLKKAIEDGNNISNSNGENENFWDEYTVTNLADKTNKEIKSGMQNWFYKNDEINIF